MISEVGGEEIALDGNKPIYYISLEDKNIEKSLAWAEKENKNPLSYEGTNLIPSIICDKNKASHIFIGGPTGSGKTCFIGELLKMNFKGKDGFLFSRKNEDPNIDDLNLERIDLDELQQDPMDIEDFKNSVCVFDDIDSIVDKSLLRFIQNFRDDLLKCGRDQEITVISTTHILRGGNATKTMIYESPFMVLFPKASREHVRDLLKTYAGFSKNQLDLICNQAGRWVFIHKNYPQYLISTNKALLI